MNSDTILALISTLFAQLTQAEARIVELQNALAAASNPDKD